MGAYVSPGIGNVNNLIFGYGIKSNGIATISAYYSINPGFNLQKPIVLLPDSFKPSQNIAVRFMCNTSTIIGGYLNTDGELFADNQAIGNVYSFNFTYPTNS